MYNGKPKISSELSTDVELLTLLPKNRMFDGEANFRCAPIYPYLTYEELMNIEGLKADDTEIESEVTFRINLYGVKSLSTIASHVNRIMQSAGYSRNYSHDLNEATETGESVKHKVMSFTGCFTA